MGRRRKAASSIQAKKRVGRIRKILKIKNSIFKSVSNKSNKSTKKTVFTAPVVVPRYHWKKRFVRRFIWSKLHPKKVYMRYYLQAETISIFGQMYSCFGMRIAPEK